jgi:hypothetical protein
MGEGHEEFELTTELAQLYGLRSVADGGHLFCGVAEQQFAIDGVTYQWPRGSHLTWGLAFNRLGELSEADLVDCFAAALKEISDCCDITHEFVRNWQSANLFVQLDHLDGPSGVLADCQIPVNAKVDRTQLRMRLDSKEAWGLFANPPAGKIDLYRVVLHELLHGHGLGHKPANVNVPALIAPLYDTRIRHLQAADKAELVRRMGPRKEQAPSVPAPTTPGAMDKLIVEELRVSVGGRKYKLSGSTGPLQMVEE